MEKLFDTSIPKMTINTSPMVTVNYGAHEASKEEIKELWDTLGYDAEEPDEIFTAEHKFAYYRLYIPMGQWSRDGIVNAIIRDKYRIDEMEAITNNMAAINAAFMQTLVAEGIVAATKYLKDSINDENTARFKEMQEWRAMAKKVASEIIKE